MIATTKTTTAPARRSAFERRTARRLAATEYDRFLSQLHRLQSEDWTKPTDCPGWDVRALVGHVVGMTEMSASVPEQLKQMRAAGKAGGEFIDALTALQVAKHFGDSTEQLVARFAAVAPKAAKGRGRTPGFVRGRTMPMLQTVGPSKEAWTFGYLIDVILTRDPWMHRVDLARAAGLDVELTGEHDGVLVADIVKEWAGRHGQPCTVQLSVSRTIDHPAQFLEYLRRRRGRKLATMVNGVDELDMFMWFVNGGMYFEPDPREVASQLPIDKPINASDIRRYEEQSRVRLGTLTDPLDAWFYSREGLSQAEAPKPTRREQPWVEQYLAASESAKSPGWLRFGADLVGLSERAQRDIGKKLKEQCRRARGGPVERSLTTHGTTFSGSWLLTVSVVPDGASIDHLPEYMDAKQYQTESSRSMLLLYNTDGSLRGFRFRGEPRPRTPERDAAIVVAPLRSLAGTFGKPPPSARRSTRQLRRKRGKKRRRR